MQWMWPQRLGEKETDGKVRHCASMLHSDGDKDRIQSILCKQGIAGTMIQCFFVVFLMGDYNSVWHGHNCVFFFCAWAKRHNWRVVSKTWVACPNLFCLLVQKIVHNQLMVILEGKKSIWETQNSKYRAFLLVRLLANQWVENPPLCTLLTLEQNVQKANKLLHCICTPTQLPLSLQNSSFQPSDTLQWKGRKKMFFSAVATSLPPSLLPYPAPSLHCSLWERGRGISLRKWRALERLESPVECSRVSCCTSGFLFLQADELIMEKWAWPQ